MKFTIIVLIGFLLFGCSEQKVKTPQMPYMMVLGVAQDAGYPQISCKKDCCKPAWKNMGLQRNTSCLAIVDPITKQQWMIDATPNIKAQFQILKNKTGIDKIDGVLLTHAHIGHYTGLMHFGREALGSNKIPAFAMPKMKSFLETNGPWSQLVALENISLKAIYNDTTFKLNERISVKPFLVPHRDEFSETVGYQITINNKSLIFIPDIDKWEKWNTNITELVQKVDYAFLDATFYKNGEIERDMSEVPHPFVAETMKLFAPLAVADKAKVFFIHLNHTNRLLQEGSPAQKEVFKNGFKIAKENQIIPF